MTKSQEKVRQTAGHDALGEFAPEFAHLNDNILFGEVWSRNDLLSLRDRSIVTVVALMSQGLTDSSFKYHLESAKKNGVTNDIVILTATSGDTGKAAMAGFADVPGTKIIVFYPKDGVSPIQEKQMVTQKGDNTYVVAIRGNFDDAQTGVKKIFNDTEMKAELEEAGYQFSSANSINIGRLVPQIVYYVYAYANLYKTGQIQQDEEINVVVPTGNFGNILAAYYAKNMGLPIKKLICASNDNKVLFDFFISPFAFIN